MNEKKYLVYLDILGFERLAEEIEEGRGIESREVREKFIDVINERVKTIERGGRITGKKYGESDDWLLLTDSQENVFKCILEILDHHTPYKGYEKIPLEIAIGTGEYDKWAIFDGKELIIENSTIKFIKTKILGYYHDWYKQKHNQKSPKSTFIVLTESAYIELEPMDRKICQKIEYKYKKDDGKEEVITFFAADVDRVQQRGRIFEFLEKIGFYLGNKLYGRIDEVYVPPLEYEDMTRTLKEKRIVFITGTQEYGKTYTAVRLMWEYYNSGYEPGWIKGGERAEREEVRRKLEDIRAELKPWHIVYFEDPFGRTEYEKREGLEREIGTIMDTVKQVEDVYVIITSREEVFKEFEKEKLSAKELGEFEKKLNIKKPSYDAGKRKEMLLTWAEEENCKWLGNKNLKELVLEAITDEKILPTPLSMKDFAVATFDVEKEDELREKIEEKSKETAKAFADEIKNMTDDKILFLSFLFIRSLEVEFVREMYQELVKELNLKDAWEFDRVLNWFKDDKISISGGGYGEGGYGEGGYGGVGVPKHIELSHPAYSEALPYLLVEGGCITRINREIFSKLLLKLSKKIFVVASVAHAVKDNFDKLPEDVRVELLLKFLENDEVTVGSVREAVADNFDKLPEDARSELLLELSKKDAGTAWFVARIVADNFDKLPTNIRNLLFKISEKDAASWLLVFTIADNFGRLPEDAKTELLLKLLDKDGSAWPEDARSELLLELSEKDESAWFVAFAAANNFDKLPEDIRVKLLFKLSENDAVAWVVARAVADNFDKLPEDVRVELLLKLSENDKSAWIVAVAVANNFDKLPEDARVGLLLKLSEENKAAWVVAVAVANNFDKLPEKVRNLLDRLQKLLQQLILGIYQGGGLQQALNLISNALPKIDQDFVLKMLNELNNCEDETVRIKAAKMLKDIFDDSEAKKGC